MEPARTTNPRTQRPPESLGERILAAARAAAAIHMAESARREHIAAGLEHRPGAARLTHGGAR